MTRLSKPRGLAMAALNFSVIANPTYAEERPIQARASGGLGFFGSFPLLVGESIATHLGQ